MAKKELLYERLIIKQLYFNHTLSCAELSHNLNRSLPFTIKLINDLMADDLVVESGYAPSTGGRRPIMYSLKSDIMYVVSVAMDQFITRIAIMDMQNNTVSPVQSFELPLPGNDEALDALTNRIEQVIKGSGISRKKIAGVGIGMPGFVDVKKGVNYSFLKTNGKSITETIAQSIKLPVFIDNDSSLIALAELRFGAAKGKKNAMVINIGWGVGLGMIINGELFRGQNGFAGEFSHIPIFSNGRQCSCGKFGCLETETSLVIVIEKAKEGLRSGRLSMLKSLTEDQFDNLEEASAAIMNAAQAGDQFAIELFSEAGYNIGRGVAILLHLLNPEAVILSGRGSFVGRIWQAPIQQAINEHCIPRLAMNTSVEISTLGYQAELIGSAALVMEHYGKDLIGNNRSAENAESSFSML